jgi:homoserine kinase
MDEVTVHSPATVSNVVCGFDCLGFALAEPFDLITVRRIEQPTIRIINRDDYGLPTEPSKNVAGVALLAMLQAMEASFGFEVEITKGIKPGSGIGSSSASSCGAVAAANHLLGNPFTKAELVGFAMEGEKLASGAKHADNVAPCIFGGFTLVRSLDPLDIVSLTYPQLFATVIHPQIEIKTSEARAILPTSVPLADAVRNWSNLGAFVAGLANRDYELISKSMVDVIVEPARSPLITNFDEVKAAGIGAGALGGGISGSGPSIFMISSSLETAQAVRRAMKEVYSSTGIEFNLYVSGIEREGVRIV